jgi:hypothetical protein
LAAHLSASHCPECATPVANTFGKPGQPNSGKAIASMIVGIAGLVIGFACCVIINGLPGAIIGPVAIVLGYAARRDIRTGTYAPGSASMATAGIVTGWIATILGILSVLVTLVFIGIQFLP